MNEMERIGQDIISLNQQMQDLEHQKESALREKVRPYKYAYFHGLPIPLDIKSTPRLHKLLGSYIETLTCVECEKQVVSEALGCATALKQFYKRQYSLSRKFPPETLTFVCNECCYEMEERTWMEKYLKLMLHVMEDRYNVKMEWYCHPSANWSLLVDDEPVATTRFVRSDPEETGRWIRGCEHCYLKDEFMFKGKDCHDSKVELTKLWEEHIAKATPEGDKS